MGFFSKLFGGMGTEPGLGVDELARRLKMEPAALSAVAVAYRELRLPKKSGGTRTLHVPETGLKGVQRSILRRILTKLAAHPAAMGFECGQSTATNAAVHVGAAVLVKMDLKDFFTRTIAQRVRAYFLKIGWGGEAADVLVKLTTYKGGLPQGAPTSPRLSNLVNYLMDSRLFGVALKLGAKYTRYADDMTFSFADQALGGTVAGHSPKTMALQWQAGAPGNERFVIASIIQCTKRITGDYGYVLHQDKKLQIRRRHDRMLVTGLVVNTALNLPRETRRKLRAVQHRLDTEKPATMTSAQLHGWYSYAAMVQAKRKPDPPSATLA